MLAKRVDVLFCASVNVGACTEGVRVPPSVRLSLTLSPPRVFDVGAVDVLFCAGVNVGACTEGVRVLPSVGRSLTLSPPRVFDVGAGVCVCLCACMLACAGAVTPRHTVITTPTTKAWGRPASESPILAKRLHVLCAGLNIVTCTEGVRALPSVARSLKLSLPRVFGNGAGVCVCLCACMAACAGAVTVPTATRARASREAPILVKRVDVLFCAG